MVTVALSPTAPSVNDVVRCSADPVDADGDALTVTRDWTIDGVSLGTDARLDLPTTAAMPGDELVCTVTVTDTETNAQLTHACTGTGPVDAAYKANTVPSLYMAA
jgi:hypothetical protein